MNNYADGLSRPADGRIESIMTPKKAREILKDYEPRWYRDVQLKRNADKAERGKEYYEMHEVYKRQD